MRRVMVIYGTRPEAIKMAPLIRALERHPQLDAVVAVTGQHREMLDQVNRLFDIQVDYDLDIMVHGASVNQVASRALAECADILVRVKPDAVVVQGDTTTALMGAVAAFNEQIPVIHLEAGLRTGDMASPFPEEANRRLISPLASLNLAPTAIAAGNLELEGIEKDSIVVTGNTVIDALYDALRTPASFASDALARLVASGERFVLVTAHRRESWGDPMRCAMQGIRDVAEKHPDTHFVVPMHRNPIVREAIEGELGDTENALLIEPLSYHDFCHAMRASSVIVTDSGGVQEEAPSLGKPVLVMRENTERPEALRAGTVRLIGTDRSVVSDNVSTLLSDDDAYRLMSNATNPYGDGQASARSAAAIAALFGQGERLPEFMSDGHDD